MENEQTAVESQPIESTVTETVSPELEKHSSFLGYRPGIEVTADEPATSADVDEPQEEVVEAEATEQDAEAAPEEEDPNWLPDEQSKVYPDEVIARYAKRYGYSSEQVASDPHLRQLLHDKINTDVYAAQLASQKEEAVEEPTLETKPEAPVALEPAKQREQYYANLQAFTKQVVDPAAAEALGKNVLAKLGVDIASEDPEVQGFVKNAGSLGMTLAEGAIDLINTAATTSPALVRNWMEAAFPGITEMHASTQYMQAYDSVRNEFGEDGQPKYGDMPDFGTKEFRTMLKTAAAKVPGFEQMVFTDPKSGRALPESQQARMRYQMLAQISSGEKPNPQVVAQAVNKGKEIARKESQVKRQGQALGAGKSRAQTPASGDDLNTSMIAAYNARNGSAFGH